MCIAFIADPSSSLAYYNMHHQSCKYCCFVSSVRIFGGVRGRGRRRRRRQRVGRQWIRRRGRGGVVLRGGRGGPPAGAAGGPRLAAAPAGRPRPAHAAPAAQDRHRQLWYVSQLNGRLPMYKRLI